MPSKKKKYNARFPAGRIKKIMQTDEEVGKVAQAVPVIICTLELFVESLLTKSMQITTSRNAKTLTPSHMKQCILSESRFDFLKDLVKDVPDASIQEDNENNAIDTDFQINRNSVDSEDDKGENLSRLHKEQSTSAGRAPVIQYGPKVVKTDPLKSKKEVTQTDLPPVPELVPISTPKLNFSVDTLVKGEAKIHIDLSAGSNFIPPVPPLIPSPVIQNNLGIRPQPPEIKSIIPSVSQNNFGQTSDNLYIDEDYDN